MSLMQKITELCIANPEGIDVEQIIKLCPEATRKQVSAAVRNAYTRGKINRLARGGPGGASRINPAIYGPPKSDQKPLSCVIRNNEAKNASRKTTARQKTSVPLNPRRMPVNSVFALAL